MKTFVAEDVLCDYTCGLIVVKAKNKKEAVKLIYQKDSFLIEDIVKKLRELKENEVVFVYGGG